MLIFMSESLKVMYKILYITIVLINKIPFFDIDRSLFIFKSSDFSLK